MDFVALKRRLIAGTGITLVGSGLTSFLGLLLMLLLVRLLSTAEFGLLMAAISMVSLTQGVLDVRLGEAVTKFSTDFIVRGRKDQALALVLFSYAVDLGISLFAFSILYFPAGFIACTILKKPELTPLLRIVALIPLGRFPVATSVATLRIFNYFTALTAVAVCSGALRFFFPILLCILYPGDVGRIAMGFALATAGVAVVCIVFAVFAIRRNFAGVRPASIRTELKTIIPFSLQTLVGVIFKNLGRGDMAVAIVTRYGRQEEVAYLKLGLQLSGAMTIVPGVVCFTIFQSFAELWAKRERKMFLHLIRRISGLLAALLVAAGILLLIAAPIFIRIWKVEYLKAMPVLYWFVAASILDGICCWIRPAALAVGKPWISTVVNFVRMVLLLGVGLILVPRVGHVGIGIATMALVVGSVPLGVFLVIRSILGKEPTHGVAKAVEISEEIG
ncbi:MAG: oligosaccharide flippase family protein [Planctomycetota bacterium]